MPGNPLILGTKNVSNRSKGFFLQKKKKDLGSGKDYHQAHGIGVLAQ